MPTPLRAYRKKNKLSQQAIAERLGISRPMVGKLEADAKNCTADMAILIEQKLGVDRILMRPDYFRRRAA